MTRKLVAMILLSCLATPAVARDYCRTPFDMPSQEGGKRVHYPANAAVAGPILRADLAEGRSSSDPIAALRIYARNFYGLKRTDMPGNSGWVSQRCGPAELYQELNQAAQTAVESVRKTYHDKRWFLSADQWLQQTNQQPGLLNLLLHANLYDAFEEEALAFLRSAKNDPTAAKLFSDTLGTIQFKTWQLTDYQKRSSHAEGTLALIPAEQTGLKRLPGIIERINAVRAEHVAYWLKLEEPRFAKLHKELNTNEAQKAALLPFNTSAETPIALAALEQARDVALPENRPALFALGTKRGEVLEADGHLWSAEQYYRFAELEDRADAVEQRLNAQQEARGAKVIAELEKTKDKFLKSESERAAYEEDTDALADELGIDLDDF
ncbi:MAG: hypothetical protein ACR2PZ_07755 [Pseudomonadales bacterium]